MERSRESAKLAMPLSSMIDVVFLLLIFFLVAARENGFEAFLNLQMARQGGPAPQLQTEKVTVELREGRIWVEEKSLSTEEFSAYLAEIAEANPLVVLMVSEESDTQLLVTAVDCCEGNGLRKTQLVSR